MEKFDGIDNLTMEFRERNFEEQRGDLCECFKCKEHFYSSIHWFKAIIEVGLDQLEFEEYKYCIRCLKYITEPPTIPDEVFDVCFTDTDYKDRREMEEEQYIYRESKRRLNTKRIELDELYKQKRLKDDKKVVKVQLKLDL